MNSPILIFFIVAILLLIIGGVLVFKLFIKEQDPLASFQMGHRVADARDALSKDTSGIVEEEIGNNAKKQLKRTRAKSTKLSFEERMMHAGFFSAEKKTQFGRLRLIAPCIGAVIGLVVLMIIGGKTLGYALFGLFTYLGYFYPVKVIDKRIAQRHEDIMFFLPLVIEEIAIGVSSSLDIGPCIQRVVAMADERGSHNVVTELLKIVVDYMRTGVSLEDALNEIGDKSGNIEVKHAFSAMGNVAKFGGEISKQLQELANSVTTQREVAIDGKIKGLELKATGPLGLIFLAFLAVLISGFVVRIMNAF